MVKRKKREPVNTDTQIKNLKPETGKYAVRVKAASGLYVRVTPTGCKTYIVITRDLRGKQKWQRLGGLELSIDEAREQGQSIDDALLRVANQFPNMTQDQFRAIIDAEAARRAR